MSSEPARSPLTSGHSVRKKTSDPSLDASTKMAGSVDRPFEIGDTQPRGRVQVPVSPSSHWYTSTSPLVSVRPSASPDSKNRRRPSVDRARGLYASVASGVVPLARAARGGGGRGRG